MAKKIVSSPVCDIRFDFGMCYTINVDFVYRLDRKVTVRHIDRLTNMLRLC